MRIAGDYFQWLTAWKACLGLLARGPDLAGDVVEVGMEVDSAGSLDDVVLIRRSSPNTYMQLKYAVDAASPVNESYLLKVEKAGSKSLLLKIADSWKSLKECDGEVEIALVTNRAPDANDPLVSLRDSRTGLLMPKASLGGPKSSVGCARARWASACGLDEAQLTELLSDLRFDTSKDLQLLVDSTSLHMMACGFRNDEQAVRSGADWIAQQVMEGRRTVDRLSVEEGVRSLRLKVGPPRLTVSVATLKPNPVADEADLSINWYERFDGDSDFSKRKPLAPASWADLQRDLESIPARLFPGASAVGLTGSFRQATGFMLGAALRDVTGVSDVAIKQGGEVWSSAQSYDEPSEPRVRATPIGQGTQVAVAVSVSLRAGDDVSAYIRHAGIPVARLIVLEPPAKVGDRSISGPEDAVALAVGIRNVVRVAARGVGRVHLFLIGPLGLSVLLGHRWNRVAPTTVYEDVASDFLYEPAFTVDA